MLRNRLLGALGGRWGKGRESGFQASVLGLLTRPAPPSQVLGSPNETGMDSLSGCSSIRAWMINNNN